MGYATFGSVDHVDDLDSEQSRELRDSVLMIDERNFAETEQVDKRRWTPVRQIRPVKTST